MRLGSIAFLGLVSALSACSDDGSSGSGDATDAGNDVTADVPVEAGPCEPFGDWTWTFQAEAGSPQLDHVKIEAAPDAGADAVKVTFLDRTVPKDMCSPPDGGADAGADAAPEIVDAFGTLDLASCTLKVGYGMTWCYSGEQQCETWDISVTLAGSSGSGSASEVGGWCMDKHTTAYAVTATKP